MASMKRKLVDTLSDGQTALLEYDFSTADTCQLGAINRTSSEYAEQNGREGSARDPGRE